jgi:RNA polymerase sigma-70 factor (ECF subfamily)
LSISHSAQERERRDTQFVELLNEHKGRVFRYIYCLVRSIPDAEDVFQQTAVTLWDKFDDFGPGTLFSTWACSIARYKALRYLETKGRQRLVFSEDLMSELVANDDCLPEMHAVRLNALAKCREKLSEDDQRLLSTCYGRERTIRDAATEIGRSAGSVYDSLSRIRRTLYHCIERVVAREGYSS